MQGIKVTEQRELISNLENINSVLRTQIFEVEKVRNEKIGAMEEKINAQQESIDFIGANLKISIVSFKLSSTTGEDASMQANLSWTNLSGETETIRIVLPNDLTLPYGKYKVWPARYGYTMLPIDSIEFEVNNIFTDIEITVVKSPPTDPRAAEAAVK